MAEHFAGPKPPRRYARPESPDPRRERVLSTLEQYMTDNRQQRMEHALVHRRSSIAMVVDGIYDMGNASAIMRTCEGLGVHHLYFVLAKEKFKAAHRTSQGAHKWLDVQRFLDPIECARTAKAQGYRLIGAALEAEQTLEEIDLDGPIAIVLGSEKEGISDEMLAECDELYRIEMRGLTQSFNVSVAAAMTLHHLVTRREAEQREARAEEATDAWQPPGDMPDADVDALREVFYRMAVNNADDILRRELGYEPPPLKMPTPSPEDDAFLDVD